MTIDFGVDANVSEAFDKQRMYAPTGPLVIFNSLYKNGNRLFSNLYLLFKYFLKVNSEFYPGWLDWWGSPHSTVSSEKIVNVFHKIMAYNNSNINFYMFFGGTNFGFSNG